MNASIPQVAVGIVLALIGVGLYSLLFTRNLIRVVVALQILGKGAMLLLVIAGRVNGQVNIGQSMALTVIVADTIVAVVALALAVQVRRRFGTLDLTCLTSLKR
jgi:NADH-quinone oxidoreductase subunit K